MSIEDLSLGWEHRTHDEALDELQRELNVRLRCFLRWIDDGRLSKSDAKDRIQRLFKAVQIVQNVLDKAIPPTA